MQEIYEEKGRAAIFRSKCRWVEKGERPTKYFFNLEKRNYNRKTITELHTDDNEIVKEEDKILETIEKFYEDLYRSKITVSQVNFDEFIKDVEIPTLDNDEKNELEGLFTLEGGKKVLETFEDNKSPGEDGFTAEFYKYFFDLLGVDLISSLNQAFEVGELSISQRRGVITLIPKEDSDLLDLQNWRPITLLNIDYKIAPKTLAKRTENVLPKLVHPDQTGFMKGRYIGENIRLICDVMEYAMVEKKGGILASLDFKKAFDTLEWQFVKKILDLFNFGENVKKWVRIFYANIENAVMNNGFATNWFKPTRGVRQGCPLSPYLFILGAEILANRLRQTGEIKGINLFGNEVKISQFADDTNLFCADVTSVDHALNTVSSFGAISGLKLNVKKTKAMWLGKWSTNKTKPLQLEWLNEPVKISGIYFSYDESKNKHLNFDLKIQKLQTKLDLWKARNLTLFGKVLIMKSLGLSQIVYAASNVNVPNEVIYTIKTKLFSFLWNNKKDKIKRESIYQEYDKGGIRMTDVEIMIKALRLAWIPRLLNPVSLNWKSVPDNFF